MFVHNVCQHYCQCDVVDFTYLKHQFPEWCCHLIPVILFHFFIKLFLHTCLCDLASGGTAKGIERLIEVRINNILLGPATIAAGDLVLMQAGDDVQEGMGWLAFPVDPRQLAVGENLVGVRVTSRPAEVREEIIIERLELHVDYD